VVTAFQEGRVDAGGDADNGWASSLDGGLTWGFGNLPGLTSASNGPFDRASDAVVTFGKDPTGKAHGGYFAYVNSLVFDDTSFMGIPSGMAVNVSSDGGVTWSNAVILEQDNGGIPCTPQTTQVICGGLNDKNWIVTDNGTGMGHHPGRTYVVWDRVASIEYAYCDPDSTASGVVGTGCDKLGNWSNAMGNGFYTLFPGQGIGTMPVVLNDGSLGVMFTSLTANPCPPPPNPTDQPSCSPAGNQIEFADIPGAGTAVWPAAFPPTAFAPVTVATYMTNGVEFQRAGGLPQVAYDPTTGDIFIGWEDNRFRTDGGSSNQNDAVVAVSTPPAAGVDAGLTWSLPLRVNQGPTGDNVDHWDTMIAVGGDGILRVGYRQRFEPSGMSPTAPSIDTYYQESSNQGQTFTAPLKVNTAKATDPQFGAFSRGGLFLGDYQELAAGGNDETYVVRDEAFAPFAGATCNTGFTTIPVAPCQNQQTFVAHLLPQQNPQTPETRFVPALVLVGAAAGGVLWRRRRNRAPAG
jgi:hypothetical protein